MYAHTYVQCNLLSEYVSWLVQYTYIRTYILQVSEYVYVHTLHSVPRSHTLCQTVVTLSTSVKKY